MALTRPRLGQLNTSVVSTSDPIQVIHAGSTAANVDIGFLMNRANGLVSNVALYWNESGNTFVTAFTTNTGTTDTNVTATSYANVTTGAHIITPGTALTSTSTTTGALIVAGGVGISGNLYVGANVNVSGNVNMTGSIVPTANVTYSLGNRNYQWKDIFVGPGTLYINGKAVLQDNSGTITFSTDTNQNLSISTSGTGDIQINPSGTGAIALQGTVKVTAGKNFTSSDGNAIGFANQIAVDSLTSKTTDTDLTLTAAGTGKVYINDNLTVSGNLIVSGTTTTINTSTLSIADNLIDLNSDVTTGTPTEDAGIRVLRGDLSAVQIKWNESVDAWQLTNDGSTYGNIVTTSGVYGSGVFTTLSASGSLSVTDSTASSSTSTGALKVSGGAGIAGAVYAGSVYDNGTRVVSTSSGAANLTISSGAITLPATGPGAVNVGSATSIPTIVTDAYGRIVGLTSNAISTSFTLAGTSGTTTVSGGNTLSFASTNGVTIAVGATYANISTPQDVRTTASPTFASGTFNGTVIATTLNAATSANHVGTGTYLTSLTATNIVGTVATANISLYDSVTAYTTNQTFYPTFANLTTGNSTQGTSTTLTYNPSTGALTATSFNGVGTFSTATTSGTLIASGNIVAASSTASTSTTTGALVVTGGVGVSGDAYHGGNVVLTNRSYVKFSPSGSSNWIGLRAPSSLSANVTYNLPSSDGTSGQVLKTDGAGNWSFGSGTAGGSSGFFSSTISVHPSATGDKDLATGADNVTQETPFSSGGTDAFGVSLGIVYDQMEPVGSYTTIDLGSAVAI